MPDCRCGQPATNEGREYRDMVLGNDTWEPLCDGHAKAARAMAYDMREIIDA